MQNPIFDLHAAFILLDFIEKFSCVIQDNIQSYHWSKEICNLDPECLNDIHMSPVQLLLSLFFNSVKNFSTLHQKNFYMVQLKEGERKLQLLTCLYGN